MKLWLLEILACPIDHAFPLQLTIFRWFNENNKVDNIADLLQKYNKKEIVVKNSPCEIENHPDGLYLKDYLNLQFTPFLNYLSSIIEKINELDVIQDKSTWKGQIALDLIKGQIKPEFQKVIDILKQDSSNNMGEKALSLFNQIHLSLEFLNLFKYKFEIEDGVIQCPNCHRWFPIFETIPQLFPDNLRQQEQDDVFKQKWKQYFNF